MRFLTVVCCALMAFASASAQAQAAEKKSPPTLPGECPQFNAVASFDSQKLSGDWFVTHCAKKGVKEDEEGRCITKSVVAKPNGLLDVKASGIVNGKSKTKSFTASPVAGSPGKLSLNEEGQDPAISITLTVIDTDYTSYAVAATCVSSKDHHGLMYGVYSREMTLDAGILDKAKAALKAQNFNEELTAIDQKC